MYHASIHDTMVIVTPLSRWQLSTQEEEKIKDVFGKKLAEITDAGEMRSMMKTLLSRSEYLMLAKRLVAFVLIEEGYPDVEIGRILHVTRATANRFRLTYRYAKEKNEPLVRIVHEVRASEVMKEILKSLVKYAVAAAGGRIPRKGIF
ncbi:hypothetical protein A3H89_05010 [Candidatus Amesbacteria bacterium RIFCSPLOWO2_02_FULL_48_11]|uniref:TrpR like protein, YerC/YecD n=5 Tax=Candidatus Amesiibacteriota TaxID=1752730 RepID=A0A0G1XIP7_9BACT|nr:MAG: hypothetical protein UX78_C0012G0026 [Candidatus Amesbacteria bacterium GW2011_GWA2_47_11]KKU94200.1 MAG: hypothetical protein UY22_C0015G0024 [Candidatus Amesbacteria bacterium GW2011_GWC1_48_10]KKW00502.1 MAG: hypothetical protein UY33_C0010G0023 [Candidatus Amesbacteria bacterium GW2011_GWA1_48_9]OGD06622.1 MAG: hypothetical protein A3H89_05010 [Candidatus Amesbacteria bacterium RIFCSPLOWO2_02_FULL_48_11]